MSERTGDSESIRHQTDSAPTSHWLSLHLLSTNLKEKLSRRTGVHWLLVQKTSSSVSDRDAVSEPAVS